MEEKTERTRVRQVVAQNKLAFAICAVIVIVAIVGWLKSM